MASARTNKKIKVSRNKKTGLISIRVIKIGDISKDYGINPGTNNPNTLLTDFLNKKGHKHISTALKRLEKI